MRVMKPNVQIRGKDKLASEIEERETKKGLSEGVETVSRMVDARQTTTKSSMKM